MKNRQEILSEVILKHRKLYYAGRPEISDPAFDALVEELSEIDSEDVAITSVGAPVEETGEFEKFDHQMPMGSLNKVLKHEELLDWFDKFSNNNSVLITEKLDGASVELSYENGTLVRALNRGNGYRAENIYRNVRHMIGVKNKLPIGFTGNIRGEIILTKTNADKYFPDAANTRNAAVGISRRLDSVGSEHLSVIVYQIISDDMDFATEFDKFEFLENTLELNVPPYKVFSGIDIINDVIKYWDDYNEIRKFLDYNIDGLVLSINEVERQNELGMKHLRPEYAIAMKFDSETARTKLLDITCQTGNSGKITPVAEIEPVDSVGAKISRATLYNFGYIQKLGLDVGAEILIARAGDVIPRVDACLTDTGTVFKTPSACPACGGAVAAHGENLMCLSTDSCPAQKTGRILNWISSLNILEWGDKLIERLVETGKVETVVDLYKLSSDDLMEIERMGKKSAQNCLNTLHADLELSIETLLGSLSIAGIGTSSIKMLTDSGMDSLEKILSAKREDFEAVKGFGSVKSKNLFIGLQRNKRIITELLEVGIKVKEKKMGKLTGKRIAITGKTEMKRANLESFIKDNGGEYKASVGATCTHLVIADVNSTSSKAAAARKLGITLVDEQSLLNLDFDDSNNSPQYLLSKLETINLLK